MSQREDRRLNVVVVDNTPSKMTSWRQAVLKAGGFSPMPATSVEEAHELLRSARVDLLVVDLFLSDSSEDSECPEDAEGLELIAECRARYPRSRIIAITSKLGGSAEIGALALQKGADDFLSSAWTRIYFDALLEQKLRIYLRLLRNERSASVV